MLARRRPRCGPADRAEPYALQIAGDWHEAAAAWQRLGCPFEEPPDRKNTFCIYDAPAPEAIRKVADRNGLPVGRITEVSLLDPYFYQP